MDSTSNRNDSSTTGNIQTVSVKQASLEIGVDQSTLRSWMKHNKIKIGVADLKDGNEKWQFTIYRAWLDEFLRSVNVSAETRT